MTKLALWYINKNGNKIESTSNSYILITVKAFNFLFVTLHTASFLYGRIYFGVLYKHSANVTRSDTSWGSKPPYL